MTGLGDHGPEGIQDFIDKHSCSVTCRALSLASMDSLAVALEERVAEIEEEEEGAMNGPPSNIVIRKDCSVPPAGIENSAAANLDN